MSVRGARARVQPARRIERLWHASRAVALTEFALAMPVFILVGGYGIELSNFALCNLRVSQAALTLADNAGRIGIDVAGDPAPSTQINEGDINDILRGAEINDKSLNLTKFGRVTLTSLENIQILPYENRYIQRIHWQRCIGEKSGDDFESHYGKVEPEAGTTNTTEVGRGKEIDKPTVGIGASGREVLAPMDGGIMFVEINYQYQPLFRGIFFGKSFTSEGMKMIRYTASYIVRDNRDFSFIRNPPVTQTVSSCLDHNVRAPAVRF